MLQASEVQEVQVLVEEEQEKAKTLDSIVVSLRSDLLLAREEQDRLAERLRLQEKEASEREEVVEAALNKVRKGGQSWFEDECFDSRLVEGLENLSLWRGQLLP